MKKLTWPAPWVRLAEAAGGIDRLGVMLSVQRRQLARWALKESTPRGQAEALIITVARTLGVRSPVGESDASNRTGALFPTIHNKTIHDRFSAALNSPEMRKILDEQAAADVAARNEMQKESRKRTAKKRAKRAARSAEGRNGRVSEVTKPTGKPRAIKRPRDQKSPS